MRLVTLTPLEDAPELSTTEYWRGIMRRARADHGLTQKQLGDKVGLSQNVISGIESGVIGSSKGVTAICEVLGIPSPQVLIQDEIDQRWIEAGRALRSKMPNAHDALLVSTELMTKKSEGDKKS
jgi:transcriptional regulator with XRE-family HTH domain